MESQIKISLVESFLEWPKKRIKLNGRKKINFTKDNTQETRKPTIKPNCYTYSILRCTGFNPSLTSGKARPSNTDMA